MKLLCAALSFSIFATAFSRPQETVKFLGFRELGKYSGVNQEGIEYEKTYYVSSYIKLAPPAARSFCKSYGMDLVSFESRNEYLVVRNKFEPELPRDKSIFVIVGGFAHVQQNGKKIFHWISTGEKIFSGLEATGEEYCLGIKKEANEPVAFIPISCDETLKFMCQDMELQYAN
ncbi:CLUMA_CG011790, isoform A [Clunio marinus]|uniref:CLUMA_CG011790, isoform A n=1 Tax=Clunio marinus TaxID=568069 RepID=A0A1J1IDZ6_9DIPT|nr:CLUMA_CG011790, isoform A [Clunio marinus]